MEGEVKREEKGANVAEIGAVDALVERVKEEGARVDKGAGLLKLELENGRC